MAYNPYFPVNYYPYYPQTQTQPTAQSGIIWVSGAQEASMYPIAPNNAVALWQKDGKTVYLKSADATGKPTIAIYDLIERTETASDGVSLAEDKRPDYATKDDLSALMSAIKGYDDTLGGIRAEIENLKADMYGIAGKKKTVRKTDDDE